MTTEAKSTNSILEDINLVMEHAKKTQDSDSLKVAQDLSDTLEELKNYGETHGLEWDGDIMTFLDFFSETEDESGLSLLQSVSYQLQALRIRAEQIRNCGGSLA